MQYSQENNILKPDDGKFLVRGKVRYAAYKMKPEDSMEDFTEEWIVPVPEELQIAEDEGIDISLDLLKIEAKKILDANLDLAISEGVEFRYGNYTMTLEKQNILANKA